MHWTKNKHITEEEHGCLKPEQAVTYSMWRGMGKTGHKRSILSGGPTNRGALEYLGLVYVVKTTRGFLWQDQHFGGVEAAPA